MPVRRRRREEEEEEEPAVNAEVAQKQQAAEGQRKQEKALSAAESGSKGTLPTDYTYAVASAATDDPEAQMIAALVARDVDFAVPKGVLKRVRRRYTDPVSGKPTLSLKQSRSMVLTSMLAEHFASLNSKGIPTGLMYARRPGEAPPPRRTQVDPSEVYKFIHAMDPLPGKVDLNTAMAFATQAVMNKVPLERFSRTVANAVEWNGETGPLDETQIMAMAYEWSRSMPRFATGTDIGRLVYPELAQREAELEPLVPEEGEEDTFGLERPLPGQEATIESVGGHMPEEVLASVQKAINESTPRSLEIARQILADEAAGKAQFKNSLLGKTFGVVFEGLDKAWHVISGAFYSVASVLGTAAQPVVEALVPGEQQTERISTDEYLNLFGERFMDGFRVMQGKQDMGSTLAEESGFIKGTTWHRIVSVGSEFLLGWALDPGVLLGNLRKAISLRRLVQPAGDYALARNTIGPSMGIDEGLDGLLFVESNALRFNKGTGPFRFLVNPEDSLNRFEAAMQRTVPGRWVKRLGLEGDMALSEFLARATPVDLDLVTETMRGIAGIGPGLDRTTGAFIADWVQNARRGIIDDETIGEVEDILRISAGSKPVSEAGLAFERVVDIELPREAAKNLDLIAQGRQATPVRVGSIVGEATGETASSGLKGLELQSLRRDIGQRFLDETPPDEVLTRLDEITQQAAQANGRFTYRDGLEVLVGRQRVVPSVPRVSWLPSRRDLRLGLTTSKFWRSKASRWIRSFSEMRPNGAVNIEDFASEEMFGRWLREWGTFSPERISDLRRRWLMLSSLRTAEREIAWEALVRQTLREAYEGFGLPKGAIEEIVEKSMQGYSQASKVMARWTGESGRAFSVTGSTSRAEVVKVPVFETQLLNTLMLPDPLMVQAAVKDSIGSFPVVQRISLERFGKDPSQLSSEQWGRVMDAVGPKGKLGEFLNERVYGQDFTRRIMDGLMSIWKPAVLLRPAWTVRVVLLDENLRGMVALQSLLDRALGVRVVGKAAQKLGMAERYISIPGVGEVPLGRVPGLMADEPKAFSMAKGTREVLTSGAQREAQIAKGLGSLEDRIISEGMPGHTTEWAKALNNVVRQSPLGRRILSMLGQVPTEGRIWTEEDIIRWVATDNRANVLTRAGNRSPEEVVRDAVAYGDSLTAGRIGGDTQQILARQVLRDGVDEPFLVQAVPAKSRPDVVGDIAEEVFATRVSKGRVFVDKLFTLFARWPTDRLSRQPFFKNMYARERERLLGLARQRGGTTDATIQQIEIQSREFAIAEVKRVMYSLTERSRFAEASRFIMPFYQPWQETFTVWGRLLWENPRAIAHAKIIGDAATDLGVIERDEEGNLILPLPHLATMLLTAGASQLMRAFPGIDGALDRTGLQGFGKFPEEFRIVPRLESLNLFLQNGLEVPTGGLAGDIEIPLPGFAPWAQAVVNELVLAMPEDWEVRERLSAWAFQFGPDVSVLPAPWKRMLASVFPQFFGEVVDQTANDFLDWAAAKGLEVDAKWAENAARQFLGVRALLGWTLPAAPIFEQPQDEIQDEIRELMTTLGPVAAFDEIKRRYPDQPDIWLLAIGHTELTGDFALPVTEARVKLFNHPDFRKVLNGPYKELAFALVPHEARDGEFDFNVYLAELADGTRRPRTPGERVKMLGERLGWQRYFVAVADHEAMLAASDIDPDSQEASVLKLKYLQPELDAIAEDYPAWEVSFNEIEKEDILVDDRLALLRNMLESSPLLAGTDMGRGIREYLTFRDEITAEMTRQDIDSIDMTLAQDLGLTERWETRVAEIRERYPDAAIVIDEWLDRDLRTSLDTDRDKYIRSLPDDYIKNTWLPWIQRFNDVEDRTFGRTVAGTPQRSKGYYRMYQLSAEAEAIEKQTGINPQEVLFNSLSGGEQRQEVLRTAMRPYVFLTPFERETILGLPVSEESQPAWAKMQKAQLQRDKALQGASSDQRRQIHEQFEAQVNALQKDNPAFAKEWGQGEQWGYGLFHVLYGDARFEKWVEEPDYRKVMKNPDKYAPEAQGWAFLQDAVTNFRKVMAENDINSYDDRYRHAKEDISAWWQDWLQFSPALAEHWSYLDNLYLRGDLIDIMFPETFFP